MNKLPYYVSTLNPVSVPFLFRLQHHQSTLRLAVFYVTLLTHLMPHYTINCKVLVRMQDPLVTVPGYIRFSAHLLSNWTLQVFFSSLLLSYEYGYLIAANWAPYLCFQWVPVTKLGRLVKDMKIKTLEHIYLFSLPIKVWKFSFMHLLCVSVSVNEVFQGVRMTSNTTLKTSHTGLCNK